MRASYEDDPPVLASYRVIRVPGNFSNKFPKLILLVRFNARANDFRYINSHIKRGGSHLGNPHYC